MLKLLIYVFFSIIVSLLIKLHVNIIRFEIKFKFLNTVVLSLLMGKYSEFSVNAVYYELELTALIGFVHL